MVSPSPQLVNLFPLLTPFPRHMTIKEVAQSVSPGIFMQGPGGLLSVPLCQRYGR